MAQVELNGVNKFYGTFQALYDVSLTVDDGSFVVFVGPSGCGKSTLLRAIAGLEGISAGTIGIDGRDVTNVAPSDRDVAMVFQSYALYPHMTVRANMEFGMKVGGVPAPERAKRVAEAARVLQLEDYLGRKPVQLSGGQRQRVAIGRAIVKDPKVFLFDEPLSNLDAKLRIQMRIELEALHKQLNSTMIYVTHDQVEAMTMADQIVVLNEGRVEQIGPPLDLYHRPESLFVAGFIGSPSMNFLTPDAVRSLKGLAIAPAVDRIGIRPEHLTVVPKGKGHLDVTVRVKESLGGESFLYARTGGGDDLVIKTHGDEPTEAGSGVGLRFAAERLHQFDADGRALGLG
ncbi:Phosphate transport ATP-binding protein PstB (TC 3.A.1.7.1) [hydrothermal vent metagenome]|uniref:Phosphate transport ATP-binding protein PstB (TC 3.A.1.7.1) n=1 Tax=hydrothermal vent metagenome TaxID=652676 RepID=A0A3B0TEL7_9ZZZZ